jgi:hypothetical protein
MPKGPRKIIASLAALACISLLLNACSSNGTTDSQSNGSQAEKQPDNSDGMPGLVDGPPPEDMDAGTPPPEGGGPGL